MVSIQSLYYIASILSLQIGIIFTAYKIGYNNGRNNK